MYVHNLLTFSLVHCYIHLQGNVKVNPVLLLLYPRQVLALFEVLFMGTHSRKFEKNLSKGPYHT